MARRIFIGLSEFDRICRGDCFYVDKTAFLADWWKQGAAVTNREVRREFENLIRR